MKEKKIKGGVFLLNKLVDTESFIPEELGFEEKELGNSVSAFSTREVYSKTEEIELKKEGVVTALIRAAGSQGYLMAEIPESYGGMNLGVTASTVIAENITHQVSFSVCFLCHAGIGIFPVLSYGSEAQKKRYLNKLATGEIVSAYALTEADAGTDAMAMRTSAVLSPDKKYYILNGEKIFCTNGGIADLITVFAKVGGKVTAFLVERGLEGVSIGREEEKMGILGSSTVSINFSQAKIPVQNLLGEIGKGHKIAFNVLNVGRFKLGCACVGVMKRLLEITSAYANQRKQFGKPISSFEIIRQKIARCTVLTCLAESGIYRFAGIIDNLYRKGGSLIDHFEELSIEASIIKIFCSDALHSVADECLQVHGGYGYIRDYPVEHYYRDNRINRIFEGTNEINRLVIVETLLKKAFSGGLPLMDRLQEILVQLKVGFPGADPKKPLADFIDQVERLKYLAIYLAGVAKDLGDKLESHQAVLATISDIIIDAFLLESGLIRAVKIGSMNDVDSKVYEAVIQISIAERVPPLLARARQTLINIARGDEKLSASFLKAFDKIVKIPPIVDTDSLCEIIASKILEVEGYI